ncbi:aliphatic sulfonate ABC transporter substrate-binding protein [Candidatus Sodalis endolongispinus]|uniref:Aliphatic sulfonate ABC transporter substrate-binding protein n=2 Tax=Candidatus Sodalis endolongispinus TaxID=2812662 RepID=A0ABS5YDC2_9GAMM|nr:aliphatic sulfonate ABC transporter substrate-binding protein [Candidatus Sodalis endolongispinus]
MLGIGAQAAARAEVTLRIGYQKSSTLMSLLKLQGTLEQRLAQQGVKISWYEFSSGLPLLEALNICHVDISADVADTVPVFAQAAGADLTYFAREEPSPNAQAILVARDSPLKTLADLKGKRIAVTKAAGSHYLLIAALEKAQLTFKDITPAYLTPADGLAAFQTGKVDAWVTWEPFVSSAERRQNARVLAGGQGLVSYQRYYLSSSAFAKQHPEVLALIYRQLTQSGAWVTAHPAQLLGPLWGNLDAATVEQANAHRSYRVVPVTRDSLAEQQRIADAFTQAWLLPKRIDAQAVSVWQPPAS